VLRAGAEGILFAGAGSLALRGVASAFGYLGAKTASPLLSNTGKVLVGQGLKSTAAQASVMFAFGGATGFALSGGDAKKGLEGGLTAVAFFVAFKGLGKLNSRFDVAGKVKEAPRDTIIKQNLKALTNIDDKFQKAYMNYERYNPSFQENMLMKATGLQPMRPAKNTVSLPKTPTGSNDAALRTKTLETANLGDAGTVLQGESFMPKFNPSIYNPKGALTSKAVSTGNKQLKDLEDMLKDQALIDEKINRYNFDKSVVNAKIDAQLKQARGFDVDKANANMNKALQEAMAEKAAQKPIVTPKEFLTSIDVDMGYPTKQINYVIKEPSMPNLNVDKQIQIKNRNYFNPEEANKKIDLLKNSVPTKGSYDDYRNLLSQGKTTTATQTRPSIDTQLAELERLTKETPTMPKQAIITNKATFTGLTSKSTMGNINRQINQKLDAQITGMSASMRNLIAQRLGQSNNSEQKQNIAIGAIPTLDILEGITTNTSTGTTTTQTLTTESTTINTITAPFPTPNIKNATIPLMPGFGGRGSNDLSDKGTSKRKGRWFKRKHPIPNPKREYNQVMGRVKLDMFKQPKTRKQHKPKRKRRQRKK
jgi:hypothetical protein